MDKVFKEDYHKEKPHYAVFLFSSGSSDVTFLSSFLLAGKTFALNCWTWKCLP